MQFNLRVYGIWIKEGKVLLSHEQINDFEFTKFPGGGVELGEGIKNALFREMREETGIEEQYIKTKHFYTTDFFQQSVFNPNEQIVSIYYLIECSQEPRFWKKDESTSAKQHTLKLEWKTFSDLSISDFTFPIDKIVLEMLREGNRQED